VRAKGKRVACVTDKLFATAEVTAARSEFEAGLNSLFGFRKEEIRLIASSRRE